MYPLVLWLALQVKPGTPVRGVKPEAAAEVEKGLNALTARRREDPPQAHFAKALQLDANAPKMYMELAAKLESKGLFSEGVTWAQVAVALSPEFVPAIRLTGGLLVKNGRYSEAVDMLRRITLLAPYTAQDHYNLGLSFYQLGRLDAAQQQFEIVISMAPKGFSTAYVKLGDIYAKTGNPAAAIRSLSSYLELFPDAPDGAAVAAILERLRASAPR